MFIKGTASEMKKTSGVNLIDTRISLIKVTKMDARLIEAELQSGQNLIQIVWKF